MKILAIDTTAKVAAAAVCDGTTPISSYSCPGGFTHSETMLPAIDSLLSENGITANDIDIFAVSSGPGSFTGVRIGVSIIKGLAFGKNKVCIGVSTLEALSHNGRTIKEDFISCPVMDARRNQLYNALFEYKDGKMTRLCSDRLISADELSKELSGYSLPVYFFGDGYEIARSAFPQSLPTPEELILQNGVSVALNAYELYTESNNKAVFTDKLLLPSYLRASQAERNYNKGENK